MHYTYHLQFIPDNPLKRALASGHLNRTGHELQGYYVPVAGYFDWGSVKLIRTCCGEYE